MFQQGDMDLHNFSRTALPDNVHSTLLNDNGDLAIIGNQS